MLHLRTLTAAVFDLSAAAALLPDIEKKFIRNATDRELILLTGSHDPRMYTPLNLMALRALHVVAGGGSSLVMAKFVAGIIARRAEDRARLGALGTRDDMRLMVFALDVSRSRDAEGTPRMDVVWPETAAVPDAVLGIVEKGREARVLNADEMIENVFDACLTRLSSEAS